MTKLVLEDDANSKILEDAVPSYGSEDCAVYTEKLQQLAKLLESRLMSRVSDEEKRVGIEKKSGKKSGNDNSFLKPYVGAIAGRITKINTEANKQKVSKFFSEM